MSHLLAVDPGARGAGVAAFAGGLLRRAAYVENTARRGADAAACRSLAVAVRRYFDAIGRVEFTEVACEWPQVYAPGKQKGDPNDLLALVGVSVGICALYAGADVSSYLPAQWKAQMPKGVAHERVLARLSAEERNEIWLPSAKGLQHNVLDAIGIGLHHLGRFERHRHIAR